LRLLSSSNLAASVDRRFEAVLSYGRTVLSPGFAHEPLSRNGAEMRVRVRGERVAGMDSGILVELPFIAVLGDTACTTVLLDSLRWADGMITSTLARTACRICIQTCREGGTRLFDAAGTVQLRQNRPNPFNTVTTIEYEVIEEGMTDVGVHDGFGRRVATVVHETLRPGIYQTSFDASALATGVYLLVLRTPTTIAARRMEVVK
jgi:hypothetical protein